MADLCNAKRGVPPALNQVRSPAGVQVIDRNGRRAIIREAALAERSLLRRTDFSM